MSQDPNNSTGFPSTLLSPVSPASDPSVPVKASPSAQFDAPTFPMRSGFVRRFVFWSVLVAVSTVWQVTCSYGDIDHAASHRSSCLVRRGSSGTCDLSARSAFCLGPPRISTIAPRWLGVFVVWVGPVWAWLPLGAWLAWRLRPAAVQAAAARRLALRFAPVAAASVFAYLVGINIVRHWVRLRGLNPSGFDPSGHTLVFGLQLVPLWAFGEMLAAAQQQAATASAAALQAEASAGAAEIADQLSPLPSPASNGDGGRSAGSTASAASSAVSDGGVDPAAPLPSPPASLQPLASATLHRRGASDGVVHHGRRASRAAEASAAAAAAASSAVRELALERRVLLLCAFVEAGLVLMSAMTAAFFHTAGEIGAAWAAVAALGLFTAGHLRASDAPWRAWLRSHTHSPGLAARTAASALAHSGSHSQSHSQGAGTAAQALASGRIARFMRSAVLWAGGVWAASALFIIAASRLMPGTRIKAGLFAQSLAYDAVILAAAWLLGGRTSSVEAEVRAARKASASAAASAPADGGRAAPAASSAAAAAGFAAGSTAGHQRIGAEDEPQPLLPSVPAAGR